MIGLVGKAIGRYHVLEQIGQGGMSTVFRAVDLNDQRQVALKVLSPYIAHEARFRARFEREIKLLRTLQHPHIIPILDFGESDGVIFIVMPFIGDGTLQDRLLQGPLDARQGGRVLGQIASALDCAHQSGVIHRDVKPSNVLMDAEGNALLSDFSFARPQETSQNLTGSALIGTPSYMSPEQCRGDPIDARSDQYSFAVMLYQVTTGSLPFEGETPMAIAMKHVSVPLPRPRQVNPNLPEEIELVLIKALAKDSALRFDSMADLDRSFQAALKAALDPQRRSSAMATTANLDRTMAMYRKYQNVKPPERRRWFERTAVVASLLGLMACSLAIAGVAFLYPELLGSNAAAQGLSEADIQATVDVIVAANFSLATDLPPGALETAIFAAVMQTIEASGVPLGEPSSTPDLLLSPTPTLSGAIIFPTAVPTATHTLAPGESPPPPPPSTWTPTPSRTPTPEGPTATQGATSTPPPTDTPVPPTSTSTPRPVNPPACNSNPGNPNYCTPTP